MKCTAGIMHSIPDAKGREAFFPAVSSSIPRINARSKARPKITKKIFYIKASRKHRNNTCLKLRLFFTKRFKV